MKINHITPEKLDKIEHAAIAMGALETGSRNRIKTAAKTMIELIEKHSREASAHPSSYKIIHTCRINLGTKKYSDYYTAVKQIKLPMDCVRETDKSLIIDWPSGARELIRKESILAYVW